MRARALPSSFSSPAFSPTPPPEERLPVAAFARSGPLVDVHDRVAAVRAAISTAPSHALFAVVDGERFVGVVTREALETTSALTVAALIERGVPTIDAWASVAAARAALESARRDVIAVTAGGVRYVGLVRADDLV